MKHENKIDKLQQQLDLFQKQIDELRSETDDLDQTYWDWYRENISESFIDVYFINSRGLNGNIPTYFILNQYWQNAEPHVLRFWAERIMAFEFEKINGGWAPSWSDLNEVKFYIAKFFNREGYNICYVFYTKDLPDELYLKEKNKDIIPKLQSYPFPDGEKRNVLDMWIGRYGR
jgi:hypothetical protein